MKRSLFRLLPLASLVSALFLSGLPAAQAAAGFDRLRNEQPLRLDFRHFRVDLDESHVDLAGTLQAMGFGIGRADGERL